MMIHTYGGGEILHNLFNSVAMLLSNKSDGIARPIMVIGISFASVWMLAKLFFSSSLETALTRYLFPILISVSIFMIPTSTVRIKDEITLSYHTVDHVPFLLAQFSQFASSLGYNLTCAFEKVMHVPDDDLYSKTGMIFGAENALDVSKFKIRNGDFEKNLREFSKQCVFYDLLLGKYSIHDLQKSTNIWNFFKENTSKVRMIEYIDPDGNGEKNASETITCQKAVETMRPYLEKETNYYVLQDIGKNLPFAYQALTSIKKDAEELIEQQLLINFFKDGFDAQGFATQRAHHQQQATLITTGSLASKGLVATRAVIEALVYAAFIFVLPLSVLPMGIRFVSTWIWLVGWIQLWPPFYAILSYIMKISARAQSDSIIGGLTSQKGLSFVTSSGLFDLHQDIAALSGYLALSIPFISYAIIQGGVSSFIHLAGSMMGPANSAASAAAGEMSTGSYSYGNLNYGQEHVHNRSSNQNSLAPSLSSGYFTHSEGSSTTTYGSENILRQSNSEFRNNMFSDESLSGSFSRSHQEAESFVQSAQNSLSESASNHTRNYGDLTYHLSQGENISENISGRGGISVQESANYMMNEAKSFAHQHGMSERDSMDLLVGGGMGIKAHFNDSNATDESWNAAQNISSSDSYQKHFQNVKDFSDSLSVGSLNDRGNRLVEGYSTSRDQMISAQEQLQDAWSNLSQVSDNSSYVESLSVQQKKSLNQDFIQWGSEKYADDGGFGKMKDIMLNGSEHQRDDLVHEFLSDKSPSISQISSNPHEQFNHSKSDFEDAKTHISENGYTNQTMQTAKALMEDSFFDTKSSYEDNIEGYKSYNQGEIGNSQSNLNQSFTSSGSNFNQKQGEYKHYQKARGLRNKVGSFVGQKIEAGFSNGNNGNSNVQTIQDVDNRIGSSSNQPFWHSGMGE